MVYYFQFDGSPMEGNRYHGKTGYGEANVFVSDACGGMDEMEVIARTFCATQLWEALALRKISETNEPGPGWKRWQLELYQQALVAGVSGYFVASPDSDIPGGPELRVRPY